MAITHITTLVENPGLFWMYTLIGLVFLVLFGFMALAWYYHRRATPGWMALLMLALCVDMISRGLIRSSYTVVPDGMILHAGRIAAVVACGSAVGIVDAYLSAHNGHLDLIRRVMRWWDNRSQTWSEMEGSHDS